MSGEITITSWKDVMQRFTHILGVENMIYPSMLNIPYEVGHKIILLTMESSYAWTIVTSMPRSLKSNKDFRQILPTSDVSLCAMCVVSLEMKGHVTYLKLFTNLGGWRCCEFLSLDPSVEHCVNNVCTFSKQVSVMTLLQGDIYRPTLQVGDLGALFIHIQK